MSGSLDCLHSRNTETSVVPGSTQSIRGLFCPTFDVRTMAAAYKHTKFKKLCSHSSTDHVQANTPLLLVQLSQRQLPVKRLEILLAISCYWHMDNTLKYLNANTR